MVTVRKGGAKSRNGCQTCKYVEYFFPRYEIRPHLSSTLNIAESYVIRIRHVKCDEEKPFCQRCISTGRTCDGYRMASAPSDGINLVRNLSPRTMARSPTQEDDQQLRSFEFFRNETVPSIAGFFSSPLWNIVLQACEKEPAVKQAVVALGALHESRPISDDSLHGNQITLATSFPLRQYSNALSALRRYLSASGQLNLDIILICALIHISIEVMQNNHANALVHLENSLQLLRQSSQPPRNVQSSVLRPITVDSDLARAFQRLDLHASIYQAWRSPRLADDHTDGVVPGRFTSLSQSKDILDLLTGKLYSHIRVTIEDCRYRKDEPIPQDTVTQVAQLKDSIGLWNERFEKYINRSTSKFSRHEQFVIDILLINHRVISIEAATCTHQETLIFDQHDSEFDEIVTLAAGVTQYLDSRTSHFPRFLLDIGVIHPLYFTATKCREPWIRQRAMSLLRSIKFQEGVWNAATQASIAEVVIARELQCSLGSLVMGERPPEAARIHSVGTEILDPVRRIADVHMSQRLEGLDGPLSGYVEWVTW